MSHFTVLVIGDNPEQQLAPYHEYECTGVDDEYVQDIEIIEENKIHYNIGSRSMILFPDGKEVSEYSDMFYRKATEEEKKKIKENAKDKPERTTYSSTDGHKVWEIPEGCRRADIPYKYLMTFEEFLLDNDIKEKTKNKKDNKFGYYVKNDTGEVISVINRTNPNSKWDWYQVGGRWTGVFKLKEGKEGLKGGPSLVSMMDKKYAEEYRTSGKVDQAKKGDIDFTIEPEQIEQAKRFWEMYIEGDKPKNDKEKKQLEFVFYKKEYYLNRYKNKEDYIKRETEFSTFAVIKDGVWYEKGNMGWFGCSSESNKEAKEWDDSFFDNWLKDLPDDTLLTVVDCHI